MMGGDTLDDNQDYMYTGSEETRLCRKIGNKNRQQVPQIDKKTDRQSRRQTYMHTYLEIGEPAGRQAVLQT